MTNTKEVQSNLKNVAVHSFENYPFNSAIPRNMLSHTNSSRYTNQTQQAAYQYGPDFQIKQKM